MNKGYIGYSRSKRSQEAIEGFEVPLSLINRSLINEFLEENKESFNSEEYLFLQKLAINKWKYIATDRTKAASWHHTSKHFNRTDHYRLMDIALNLIRFKDSLDDDYKQFKDKQKNNDYSYGVIKVQVWGGSKRYPKIVDYETEIGIVKGDWLYYLVGNTIKKYKLTANKTEWFEIFDTYKDLVKSFNEYKGTVKRFNQIIKLTNSKK